MLPDFPRVKARLQRLMMLGAQIEISHSDPIFGEVSESIQFEGEGFKIVHEDGMVDEQNLEQHFVQREIAIETALSQTLPDIWIGLLEMANDLNSQKHKQIYESIERITNAVGTSIDMKGKPFEITDMLDALGKIDIDFDDSGNPILPTIVTAPDLFEKIKMEIELNGDNIEYKKRHEEIINKKKEDWRAREADRELVG